MIYEKTISTPITATEASPQKTVWKLEKGIITDLRVYFPAGSANLLHVIFFFESVQIFPKTSGSFSGHGGMFEHSNIGYPLLTPPYELILYTWNESTKYAHSVYLYLDISRTGVYVE